jgi:hypothetical protein
LNQSLLNTGRDIITTKIDANKPKISKDSMRTAVNNSPVSMSPKMALVNGISDSALPFLNITSPMNQTASNIFKPRTIRTRYIPYWDAKQIKDSQSFVKEQNLKQIKVTESKYKFRDFLENQIIQRRQFEKLSKEQTQIDFNNMISTMGDLEKRQKFNDEMKKKKLNELNNQMLKQSELNNSIRLRQQRHVLQKELEMAAKDKNVLDVDKINEYMTEKDKKISLKRDMQQQIEMNQKLNKQYVESNKQEVTHMLQHEFDLIGMNEVRHQEKISNIANKIEKINLQSTQYGKFVNNPINGHRNTKSLAEDTNTLLFNSFHNSKDLSEEERNRRSREILKTYKQQILEKEMKRRKRSEHVKLVERVLVEKQNKIESYQADEERLISLSKKAKQRRDLDQQIIDSKKHMVDEDKLTLMYL